MNDSSQLPAAKRGGPEGPVYTIILFVVSDGPNSVRARENLERLCEERLPGRHRIQIVDVVTDFQTALEHNILLTPSVVITDPPPRITVHGDLSDSRKFIEALNRKGENVGAT